MKLDIGGGTMCALGYENVDPVHGDGILCTYIQAGLTGVPDGSVETARASHVMEHIPAGKDRLMAMNTVHRVLRPGGEFLIIVPCVGRTEPDGSPAWNGWQPWADPTHVSYWWYPESFWYFVAGKFAAHADYGISYWDLGEHKIVDGWEAHVTLVKPL